MEVHFELTPEDVQTLIDETVDARVKRNGTYFTALTDWQGRYLARLLMGLGLLGAALSPWLLYGRYTVESIIALVLVLPLAFIILRRYSTDLVAFCQKRGQEREQRIRLRSHTSLSASMRKRMEHARTTLPGVHTWHITPDTLQIVLPNGQQSVIPRRPLVHLSQTASFYRLATRAQKLMGVAYVLPKQSRVMDTDDYEQGVAMLLERCMPDADKDRKTPRR
ncbi:hypothetical protein OU800_20740 [Pseudomonas sp. GOM7]|uniref:hypothetical protein n=1 Tax=Pseudomonas sp. GOM7 TaxID=2998079 RepID=UPI00227D2373|nr:hypothetical protein [Pseudomonas sp. GOM7]WAJ37005.1 hypothetical protein OU800_20740 [Pseudomonas sp. GOM7]